MMLSAATRNASTETTRTTKVLWMPDATTRMISQAKPSFAATMSR